MATGAAKLAALACEKIEVISGKIMCATEADQTRTSIIILLIVLFFVWAIFFRKKK